MLTGVCLSDLPLIEAPSRWYAPFLGAFCISEIKYNKKFAMDGLAGRIVQIAP